MATEKTATKEDDEVLAQLAKMEKMGWCKKSKLNSKDGPWLYILIMPL